MPMCVRHIAAHGITPEEVVQVFERGFERRKPNRSEPGRWVVRDYTAAKRFLVVSFELEWLAELNCWGVTPVTAFEPMPEL